MTLASSGDQFFRVNKPKFGGTYWGKMKYVMKKYLLVIVLVAVSAAAPWAKAERPPNIIYILADDLGYGDLSCFGQTYFETPNIDRLAAEGMRFMQHYSGSTVCAPSRTALMTGLHTGHTPVRGNSEVLPEGQEPMPCLLYTSPSPRDRG